MAVRHPLFSTLTPCKSFHLDYLFSTKKMLTVQMAGRRPQAILVCVPSDIFFTMHNNCAVIEILGSFEGWNYSLVA